MQNKKAFRLLNTWAKPYLYADEHNMKLIFDENAPIGTGKTNEIEHKIIIGIEPLKLNGLSKYQQIKDADFVKIGVTVFHEITHHEQETQNDIPKEIKISELSKYKNPLYYQHNWHVLPHEIDAEHGGIMQLWAKLEDEFPDKADKLMLDHLTDRAANTIYMIDLPKEGFVSREQVETLFERAYDNAVRELPQGFLRSDDETARILTTEDRVLRPEYALIYNKLTAPPSGEVMDNMMASLVSYIHPELQADYPDIDFDKLKPSHIFKIPVPEISEEIRNRLDLDDSFTKAVKSLNPNDSRLML